MCVFQVIKTLDPKQKSNVVPAEVQALKNQLTEKDRKIQHMEVRHTNTLIIGLWLFYYGNDHLVLVSVCFQHDFEKTRSRHDQEEKLIISAWYNMVRRYSRSVRTACD